METIINVIIACPVLFVVSVGVGLFVGAVLRAVSQVVCISPLPEGGRMESENRVLTCVYCGQEYPQDTPAWGDKVLTDHIKVCEKHPMYKLRKALVGLVGADTKEELEKMEAAIRILPAPDADKAVTINAIHALLDTL